MTRGTQRMVNHSPKAVDAFQVHRALMLAEAVDPTLRENPQWTIIKADAYERFVLYMVDGQ